MSACDIGDERLRGRECDGAQEYAAGMATGHAANATGRRTGDGLRAHIVIGVTPKIRVFNDSKRGLGSDGLLDGPSGTVRLGLSFDSTAALAGTYDSGSTKSQEGGSVSHMLLQATEGSVNLIVLPCAVCLIHDD